MIDGAISKSSEIIFLLNKSFENKSKSYFLVCKSFSDEILFMLKENYNKGITNVIPLVYGFDLESINSLPDLVSVVGGLPISPKLGDIISGDHEKRYGKSDECKIEQNKIFIKSNIDNSVHVARLSTKISSEIEDSKKELLSKRLVGLNSNSCKITLPKNKNYDIVEKNLKHGALLIKEFSQNLIFDYRFRKQKFYVSRNAFNIQQELQTKVDNLLKTKIFLPRRHRGKK